MDILHVLEGRRIAKKLHAPSSYIETGKSNCGTTNSLSALGGTFWNKTLPTANMTSKFDVKIAICMGHHLRLGFHSPLYNIPIDILKHICQIALYET